MRQTNSIGYSCDEINSAQSAAVFIDSFRVISNNLVGLADRHDCNVFASKPSGKKL